MSSTFSKTLGWLLEQQGIDADRKLIDRLEIHWNLLSRWNERINLTAIREETLAAERLYFDSLVVTRWLSGGATVHDVGSGAGFPGLVIKAAREDCMVCVSEAREKKVAFLKEAARRMGLSTGLAVARARIGWDENMYPRCEEVISRAAFPPEKWIELARSLVVEGGRIWLMLGHHAAADFDEELNIFPGSLPGGLEVEIDHYYVLPVTGAKRRLLGVRCR